MRAGGQFVQIHNPDEMQIYYSHPDGEADPEQDIINIEKKGVRENESNTNQDW